MAFDGTRFIWFLDFHVLHISIETRNLKSWIKISLMLPEMFMFNNNVLHDHVSR